MKMTSSWPHLVRYVHGAIHQHARRAQQTGTEKLHAAILHVHLQCHREFTARVFHRQFDCIAMRMSTICAATEPGNRQALATLTAPNTPMAL